MFIAGCIVDAGNNLKRKSIMISSKQTKIMSGIIDMVHYQRFQSYYKILEAGHMDNRLEARYHTFALSWSVCVIIQLLMISYAALTTRFDMVLGQYGCGLQYITVWNAVAHMLYFGCSVFVDQLPDNDAQKPLFKKILTKVFHCFIFPFTFSVVILFWLFYFRDERLLDKFGALRTIITPYNNHSMHTSIIPIVILELFIADRPSKLASTVETIISLTAVHLMYGSTILFLNYLSGEWPYPLLAMLSWTEIISLTVSEVTVSILIWRMCTKVRDFFATGNREKRT